MYQPLSFISLTPARSMPALNCCKNLSTWSLHLNIDFPSGRLPTGVALNASSNLVLWCRLYKCSIQLIHLALVVDFMSGSLYSTLNSQFFLILHIPSSSYCPNFFLSTLFSNTMGCFPLLLDNSHVSRLYLGIGRIIVL